MDCQKIHKTEHLWKFKQSEDKITGEWVKQYCVLYDCCDANAARLEWCQSEADWGARTHISGVFLEEVRRVTRVENSRESRKEYGCTESTIKTLFAVYCSSDNNVKPIVLRCETESGTRDWIGALEKMKRKERSNSLKHRSTPMSRTTVGGDDSTYDPKTQVDTFDVEIENTASAERCKLNNNNKYRLALSTQHITLLDPDTEIPLLSWLYKYVRRFGINNRSLLLEGGRSSAPGDGLFIFKTGESELILKIIEAKMKAALQPAPTYANTSLPRNGDGCEPAQSTQREGSKVSSIINSNGYSQQNFKSAGQREGSRQDEVRGNVYLTSVQQVPKEKESPYEQLSIRGGHEEEHPYEKLHLMK